MAALKELEKVAEWELQKAFPMANLMAECLGTHLEKMWGRVSACWMIDNSGTALAVQKAAVSDHATVVCSVSQLAEKMAAESVLWKGMYVAQVWAAQ